MASIGKADLIIVPKFNGLTAQVQKALGDASSSSGASSAGSKAGSAFAAGFGSVSGVAKAGALMGAFSAVTSKAMDVVASHVGDAVNRLDTLKNYPQVMQSLGVGAQEAQTSIQMMSDRLSVLPTRLDTMAQTVQGLYAATKDSGISLTQATKAGLALNDMLLAGGQSTSVVTAAAEQFRQMMAKGKPDMQDWRSLLSAAPGQMDQLAKSMLGATATTDQLYYALGGGNEKLAKAAGFDYATISVGQLMDALVQLDSQGGANFDSFAKQAEKAQGGIQTAMANMSNAITKGMANVMDSFGRENIVGIISDVKSLIYDGFSGVTSFMQSNMPAIMGTVTNVMDSIHSAAGTLGPILSGVASTITPIIQGLSTSLRGLTPVITTSLAAFAGFKAVSGIVGGLGSAMSSVAGITRGASNVLLNMATVTSGGLSNGLLAAASGAETLAGVFGGPWGIVIGAAVAGVTILAGKLLDMKRQQDEYADALGSWKTSLDGIDSALSTGARAVDGYVDSSKQASISVEDLTKQMQDHNTAMDNITSSASDSIAMLGQYKSVVDECAGAGQVSAEQYGKLKWAIDGLNGVLGTSYTAEDVLKNKYEDESDTIDNLIGKLDQLIQKKQEAARADAYQDLYEEEMKNNIKLTDEAKTANENYADAQKKVNDYTREYMEQGGLKETDARAAAIRRVNSELEDQNTTYEQLMDEASKANSALDDSTQKLDSLATSAGVSSMALSDAGQQIADFFNGSQEWSNAIQATSFSIDELAGSIVAAGISTDTLSKYGAANFQQLAASCDGSVQTLVSKLEVLNGIQLADKDMNVRPDGVIETEGLLINLNDMTINGKSFTVQAPGIFDVMGMVINLNNMTIDDKPFTVKGEGMLEVEGHLLNLNNMTLDGKELHVSDDGSISDLQSQLNALNGTSVNPEVNVTGNGADGSATEGITRLNGQIDLLHPSSVDINVNGTDQLGSAAQNVKEFNENPVQSQSATVNVNADQVQTAHQLSIDFNGDPIHDQAAAMIVEYASLVGANDAKVQYFAQQLQDQTAIDSVTYDTVPGATWANQLHNGTGLTSFGATDSVAFGTVPIAMGANIAYNGAPPSNFSAMSSVESGSVPVAMNNNRSYNASPPQNFSATSTVSSNAAGAASANRSYNDNPPKSFSAVTTITRNLITNTIHNIITHVLGGGSARGGVVAGKGHASGAIFTGKTWIDNQNYIGENGAEYYDGAHIVPLTNRQYSQPFADILAEGITRRLTRDGGGNGGGTTNVYIDGAQVNSDAAIEGAFYAFMGELARIKDMGPQKAGVM